MSRYDNSFEIIPEFAVELEDKQGNFWGRFARNEFGKYDGDKVRIFRKEDGFTDNAVRALDADSFGNIWVSALGDGVFKYDGQRVKQFTSINGLWGNNGLRVYEDSQKQLWLSTQILGISKYDGDQFVPVAGWREFGGEDVNAYMYVVGIFEDRRGHMWFGGNYGALRYDGADFTLFNDRNELPTRM